MAEGGHSEAGQDATVLHQQLEAAGTRLEELVEENEDLQIKCKELEENILSSCKSKMSAKNSKKLNSIKCRRK